MSSEDYFDDICELDAGSLARIDAIEASHSHSPPSSRDPGHLSPSVSPAIPASSSPTGYSPIHAPAPLECAHKPASPTPVLPDVDDDGSFDDVFDDIDPADLARLDKDVEDAYRYGINQPRPNVASGSGVTRQLTLFGDTLPASAPRSQHAAQQSSQLKPHRSPRNRFGQKLRKTKKWDHTAFAKSGWKSGKASKGKENIRTPDTGEDIDEEQSGEMSQQSITQKYSFAPPPPFKHKPDILAAQTWIFPTNNPKRDYQFNIVRESLFENALVAIPTGLGKTFIAGVIMLNYYRWFPEGKVVFVAPTKPLVAQQIEACHKTCGIPGGDAAELTGQNPRIMRAKAWAEKRVFYMTPQTLMNDLRTENCDATDIVLLVIDEAHKATGDHAYAQVVRYLMAKNAHFRILALTATPGSKAEAVQAIVDSLHISHIEIRDENSIDLRAYMQRKEISTHIIKMNEDVSKVRDMLIKLMDKTANRLIASGLLPNYNPIVLHTFRCNALMRQYSQDGTSKKYPWIFPALKKLGSLARAMAYLLECSMALCHRTLQELTGDNTTRKTADNLRSDPLFRDLVKEIERQHNTGFAPHPKMEKLLSLVVDYFAQAAADAEDVALQSENASEELREDGGNTRMMVFTNYRASVDEIVDVLNAHRPMIRATPFVGQGADKNGKRGIAQKEQLEVIQKFKDGVYNVLVSTSIGEEGLDIGEVDMIICYDAQKTPIRMLQRVGRTGRRRAGRVAVLLSENREEANWDKAKRDYESVQTSIVRGESLELFGDVNRLLPESIKPKCLETKMMIEEYVRDTRPPKPQDLPKGTKRKRNVDVNRNIPEGASTGFVSSAKLVPRGAFKKRKVESKEYDLDDVNDDEDDLAIQAGIHGSFPDEDKLAAKGKGKGKAAAKKPTRKPSSTASRRKKLMLPKSPKPSELTLSQLSCKVKDDSDDMDIERGIASSSPGRPLAKDVSSGLRRSPSFSDAALSIHSPSEPPVTFANGLLSSHSWLLDSDSDVQVIEDASPSSRLVDSSKVDCPCPKTPKQTPDFRHSPLSHVPMQKIRTTQSEILPEAGIVKTHIQPDVSPELSFSIRAPGVRKRKRVGSLSSPSVPISHCHAQFSSPAPSPSRLATRKAQNRGRIDPAQALGWLDLEAEVSGDDAPDGSSDTEGLESESDRRFLQELDATQASPSYDQTAAYRNSLLTQVPGRGDGPRFTTKPVRRGGFGNGKQSIQAQVSSSPIKDEPPDQYSMDSFVVEDDDDMV